MMGSEKQIKWAEDIKRNLLKNLDILQEKGFDVAALIENINKIEQAKTFIDAETKRDFRQILPVIIKANKNNRVVTGRIKKFTDLVGGAGAVVFDEEMQRDNIILLKDIISIS